MSRPSPPRLVALCRCGVVSNRRPPTPHVTYSGLPSGCIHLLDSSPNSLASSVRVGARPLVDREPFAPRAGRDDGGRREPDPQGVGSASDGGPAECHDRVLAADGGHEYRGGAASQWLAG